MKYFLNIVLLMLCSNLFSQETTPNIEKIFQWKNDTIVGSTAFNNAYNEVWGFVQNDREFAVIGSTEGTHIFDVTDTDNISDVAFIEGAVSGPIIIHRDYHDFNGFLYIVADEGPSTLQIVDVRDLPNSFNVVYDSNNLIIRSHNIFIDSTNAVMYTCGGALAEGGSRFAAISLENPLNPTMIQNYEDAPWGYVHDAYVKDNIGYLHCGENGFYIVDFNDHANPVVLGLLEDYDLKWYNHSGWLTDDGLTYVMCDEKHGRDVYILDVSDPSDIQIKSTVDSGGTDELTIAHNAMIRGDYLFVSYYYDGLQIYDLSDSDEPCLAGSYDTSIWGYDDNYRGNWGVYCYLPSGLILASDMQEGLFVFKVVETSTDEIPCAITPDWCGDCGQALETSVADLTNEIGAKVYPIVFDNEIQLETEQILDYRILDINGKLMKSGNTGNGSITNLNILSKGIYILSLSDGIYMKNIKIVKQ